MSHNQKIGHWGEEQAARHLQSRGDILVSRNARTPYGEIDIITQRGELTIFVEVKTRTTGSYGNPEDAITQKKQAHLIAAAEHYASENNIEHWQVDVIAIQGNPNGRWKLNPFENVIT